MLLPSSYAINIKDDIRRQGISFKESYKILFTYSKRFGTNFLDADWNTQNYPSKEFQLSISYTREI